MERNKKDLSWKESRCKSAWLHDYKISGTYPSAIRETCNKCGKSIYIKIANERIDNLKYIKYHMKQVLMKEHPLYIHEYGKL